LILEVFKHKEHNINLDDPVPLHQIIKKISKNI